MKSEYDDGQQWLSGCCCLFLFAVRTNGIPHLGEDRQEKTKKYAYLAKKTARKLGLFFILMWCRIIRAESTYRQFMKKSEQEEACFVEVEKEKSAAQERNETESSETASKDCWHVLDRNVQGR